MSEYNAKNYTEQGGEVTHIGGKIVYDNGLLPNMSTADVTSDSAAKVRATLNTLITNLKNAGLMVGDAFAMQYAAVTDSVSGHADRQYNTGKISSVAVDDDTHEITITLSDKVKNLKDFDGGNGRRRSGSGWSHLSGSVSKLPGGSSYPWRIFRRSIGSNHCNADRSKYELLWSWNIGNFRIYRCHDYGIFSISCGGSRR